MTSRPTRATADGRTYLDLQNLARRTRRTTQELLHLYALEGFLARLTTSAYARQLVLKGGVLLAAYGARRATRDVDLQGRHISNDVEATLGIIREIASTTTDDGLAFRTDTASAQTIRDDDNYQGVRVSMVAMIATAEIAFHVDVNVGDPIWPEPQGITVPGLLGRDVDIIGYPLAMVHAEKIVTAVDRGPTNTRWRDFADIYALSGQHSVSADELRESIRQVAKYRNVLLSRLADSMPGWAEAAQPKWAAWHRKQQLAASLPVSFRETLDAVAAFADPVLAGNIVRGAYWSPKDRTWRTRQP
jgi:hypothetical protein